MASIDSTTGFLHLPPELRNRVYREYFSLHRGRMQNQRDSGLQNGNISKYMHETDMRTHTSSTNKGITARHPTSSDIVFASPTGPATILLASKFIFNEAFAIFLHSTTFSFTNSKSWFGFVRRYDRGMRKNIRSIVIDQTGEIDSHDLKFMIKMAIFPNSLPSLSSFCIHLDSASDFFWSKAFHKIEKLLLKPKLFSSIEASAIDIIDPSLKHHDVDGPKLLSTIPGSVEEDRILSDVLSALKVDLLAAGVRLQLKKDREMRLGLTREVEN